jgi:hypothetical protein
MTTQQTFDKAESLRRRLYATLARFHASRDTEERRALLRELERIKYEALRTWWRYLASQREGPRGH